VPDTTATVLSACQLTWWGRVKQQEQEEIFRDMSEVVNSQVVWYILLQVVVLLVVAAWQLRHLTLFFAQKKVT